MHLFLTSSPCDDNVPAGVSLPCILDVSNGFVDRLAACFKPDSKMVIVAAAPHNFALNDEMRQTFHNAFNYHHLSLRETVMIDARNDRDAGRLIALSDVVMLAGGHVPTQLDYFNRLGLKQLLAGYTGIVMGISAGTMNCAKTVYVQPEEPGESIDPGFVRFAPGLGFTRHMLLPHYQKARHYHLDGRRLYEDITYGDSHGHAFIAMVDGTYIYEHAGQSLLCGEAYRIADGQIQKISERGQTRSL